MRGDDQQQSDVFSYISAEQRVPQNHPLRPIREMVDEVLAGLSARFARMYAKRGRPSIAPEKLLRALVQGNRFNSTPNWSHSLVDLTPTSLETRPDIHRTLGL